jgi:O-antigen ligase
VLLWVMGLLTLRPGERPHLRGSPVHLALLLFLATAVLSVVFNAETLVGLGELDLGIKKIVLLVSYILLFAVVASSLAPLEVQRFIALLVVLSSITSVGTLVEYRTGYNPFYAFGEALLPGEAPLPGIVFEADATGRTTILGPTSHPLALAALMALALPFALVGMLDSSGRRKLLYALATGLILAGTLVTQRKTGAVAVGAEMLVLFAYRPRPMVRLLPVGLVLALAISVAAPGAIGTVRDGLRPAALFSQISTRDRQSDYDAVAPDVAKYPVLGRGYQTYDPEKYRVLDNEYLAVLLGNGVLGVAAYLFVLVSVLFVCHRVIRSDDPVRARAALAVASGTAAVAVSSQLFDVIAFPHVPYMFMFMAGVAVACALPGLAPRASRPERMQPPPILPSAPMQATLRATRSWRGPFSLRS